MMNKVNALKTMPTWLLVAMSLTLSCCESPLADPPFAPEDALKTFRLPKGYRIELVASEPLVTDPVEIAFDADGLLYVAEMEDYPAEGSPRGRIMVLEDKDGDNYYESGNVFAENFPYVNGVMPWRNGVLVTSAPDIVYLEDTTGDRRADIRRVVLTGFALTNPQLRMSSLRYGLDNWIYGAYSRAGGQRGYPQFTNHGLPLRFPDNPMAESADIYPGTDFRFQPADFRVELSGGMSQFGLTFDAAGNRFTVWNNIHLRHVVIDGRYPAQNHDLHIPSLMASVSDHGDAAPVFSQARNRLDLHESEIGHFTSACGHSVYTGGLFTGHYAGAAFVCEPVSNLVHADLLSRNGATFVAERDREGQEFLTSTDSWFRPVNTTVGPDGGLYVVDFYRKIVEHPAWIARADDKGIYTHAGVLQESDFLEGNDRGRIYRVVPEDFQYKDHAKPALRAADLKTLVGALAHPNMWWRTTAQRLLVERRDTTAMPALKRLLRASPSPEARIHALWTMEGLKLLEDGIVLQALADESAAVRKQAVLLAEPRLSGENIRESVLALTSDADTHVQLQVALTLTTAPAVVSFEALSRLALQHITDPWFRHAVLLNARGNSIKWFRTVHGFETSTKEAGDGKLEWLRRIASITAATRNTKDISQLLSFLRQQIDSSLQLAALQGLRAGIRSGPARIKLTGPGQKDLFELIASPAEAVRTAALEVAENISMERSAPMHAAVTQALQKVSDTNAPGETRTHAIRVMGLDPGNIRLEILDQLLSPRQSPSVQAAAARVLTRREDPETMALLLRRWQSYTAEVRAIVENGFTGSASRLNYLLTALEEGVIRPSWLSGTTRSRLTQHPDPEVRQRVEKMLLHLQTDHRDSIITAFFEATTLGGNAATGKEIFKTACSVCHELDGAGRAFGPDLLSVSNQTRINLLTMILDPSNNIAPGYDGYLLETTEGHTFTGILGNETASAVMLRTADGAEHVIARENIKTIFPLPSSLMPEGLEANYSKQDMADLLEFLKKGSGDKL